MVDRHRHADTGEPDAELVFFGAGVLGSESLGVVIDVQRAGDHLLTRPVFLPFEAVDYGFSDWLSRDAWSRC